MSNRAAKIDKQNTAGLKRVRRPRKGWHPEDIKCELRKRGWTMSRVSREHGYSSRAAERALYIPWPAVERIIAELLERKPWELWPDRYDEYGRPVVPGTKLLKRSWGGRKRKVELRAVE
jgi:Ner family transcriptional regulator